MSIRIIGTGRCLPDYTVENDMLTSFLDTSDEWIRQRTGISSRRLLIGQSLLDIAARSAELALEDAGISSSDVDYILCSTLQGDYKTPSLACMVQKSIGAACPAVDINAACTGFLYALDLAEAYVAAGKAQRVLIVSAEAMSRVVDWQDRSTCVLFGDGAGAVVVTKGDDVLALRVTASGSDDSLRAPVAGGNCPYGPESPPPAYLYMDGKEVYRFAVSAVEADVEAVLRQSGLQAQDIDWYLLHQANNRIVEAARKRVSQPEDKFPVNISRYGNTSSASIPILLDELNREGRLKAGDKLLMCAFGAGMTTGACILKWSK